MPIPVVTVPFLIVCAASYAAHYVAMIAPAVGTVVVSYYLLSNSTTA